MKAITLTAALVVLSIANSAQAGIFGLFKSNNGCGGCSVEPTCCAPVDPTCCAPVDPSCVAPAACGDHKHADPSCCAPVAPACNAPVDPACCAPAAVTDGCGNEAICEYTIIVKDCKAPSVVCYNGLSVNIMPTGMITMNDVDFLEYTVDNYSQTQFLHTGIRKCGTG